MSAFLLQKGREMWYNKTNKANYFVEADIMTLMTVKYDFQLLKNDEELEKFKAEIDIMNIIYLFFKDYECLYIGETNTSLKERCYTHSPKHSGQKWFKEGNQIHIIQLDNKIDKIARQLLEGVFILAYRPKNNKKG